MFITLKQARETIAPFVGKSGLCPTDERVRVRVLELVERLLHMGANGNLRKWTFNACNGYFTAPPDLDTILKVTIDGFPERTWSKWYEFSEASAQDVANISQAPLVGRRDDIGAHEEPNEFYTINDLPRGGARVSAIAFDAADEGSGASVIVQGLGTGGEQIYTKHAGNPIHGEYLQPKKDAPYYSASIFTKITGIQKSRSINYIRLYWFNPVTHEQGLLAQYRPEETLPSYRRFRVNGLDSKSVAKITVLGRVRILDHYHDHDIIPISNLTALRALAVSEQQGDAGKVTEGAFHFQKASRVLDAENEYRRTGNDGLDFGWETSPANMENLV